MRNFLYRYSFLIVLTLSLLIWTIVIVGLTAQVREFFVGRFVVSEHAAVDPRLEFYELRDSSGRVITLSADQKHPALEHLRGRKNIIITIEDLGGSK